MTFMTKINWGRERTPTEKFTLRSKLNEFVAEQLTDDVQLPIEGVVEGGARVWTTEEAATEWVAFVNTYDPPPLSAEVVIE